MVFMSPIPTLMRIWERKSVGELPLLPYTAMLINAFLWFIYGFLLDEPKIWTSNAIGFFVGCFYFLEFVRYAPKRSRTLPGSTTRHFQACFVVILGTLLLALVDPSGTIIGYLAVLSCLAMFASPLAALPTVIESKSAESIPLTYTVAVFINSLLWTAVGTLKMHDIHIYFPTLLGLILSMLQIALKFTFGDNNDYMKIPLDGTVNGIDTSVVFFSPLA